ncbi:MAG: carboxypeptidase-like regulatory domain-containing protein [Planctomycetota bacterium]
MNRPLVLLLTVGAAVAILLAARSGYAPDSAEAATPSRAEGTRPEDAPEDSRPLAAVEADAEENRRAPVEGDDALEGDDDSVPPATLAGTFVAPTAFGVPESVDVFAWRDGDELPSGDAVVDLAARSFVLSGLAPGDGHLVVRAHRGERSAWGRLRYEALVAGEERSPLTVLLEEYVVEGLVLDQDGLPIANLPVSVTATAGVTGAFASGVPEPVEELDPAEVSARVARLDAIAALLETELASIEDAETIRFASSGLAPVFEESESEESETTADAPALRLSYAISTAAAVDGAERVGAGIDALVVNEASPILLEDLELQLSAATRSYTLLSGEDDITLSNRWISTNMAGATNVQLSATTDGAGRFRVWLPGPASFEATAPEGPRSELPRERRYLSESTDGELTEDEPRTSVSLELTLPARIVGRATAPARQGEQEINLFVRSLEAASTDVEAADEDGRYAFEDLRPGDVVVYARTGGSQGQDLSFRTELRLVPGEERLLDPVLRSSGVIEGVLVDADGAPVPDVTVIARGKRNANLRRTGETDETGYFRIVGMYAAPYSVEFAGSLETVDVDVGPGARRDLGRVEFVQRPPDTTGGDSPRW